jgi:predicted transcriptional regulator
MNTTHKNPTPIERRILELMPDGWVGYEDVRKATKLTNIGRYLARLSDKGLVLIDKSQGRRYHVYKRAPIGNIPQ